MVKRRVLRMYTKLKKGTQVREGQYSMVKQTLYLT